MFVKIIPNPLDYTKSLNLMNKIVRSRIDNPASFPDILLLLQHKPTFTAGRRIKSPNIESEKVRFEKIGAEYHEVQRGGQITYHGPGQLMAYPIINLSANKKTVKDHMCNLEKLMMFICSLYNVGTHQTKSHYGIWVNPKENQEMFIKRCKERLVNMKCDSSYIEQFLKQIKFPERKIGAIGCHVSRHITSHGFALNIDTDLTFYNHITGCGITDKGVTSLFMETDDLSTNHVPSFEHVVNLLLSNSDILKHYLCQSLNSELFINSDCEINDWIDDELMIK